MSSLTKVQVPQESTPNYSKANWEAMNTFFNQYDFGELYGTSDLEDAWNCLKRIIFEGILQFVPKTCSRRYPHPKWFNSEIQHQLNKVHTLRHRCRNNLSSSLSSQLYESEARLSEAMVTAKLNFESQLIQDLATNNSSRIYKYISTLSSNRQLPSIMYLDNTQAYTSSDRAQLFNQYFHSVFTHSSYKLPSLADLSAVETVLSTINISLLDVSKHYVIWIQAKLLALILSTLRS